MGRINLARVIVGGLIAGVAMNVLESLANGLIKAPHWAAAMGALGKPAYSASALVLFIIWGFIFGIAAVWIYAAIRPRFGAGPGAAAIAGVTIWVPAFVLCFLTLFALGIIPLSLVLLACAIGLVESVIAALAGAYFYNEE